MRRIGAVLFFAAAAATAQASIDAGLEPGVDFTTPGSEQSGISYTLGFTFSVSTRTTVSRLGYFDAGDDGLTQSHPVGLFDVATGNLLRTATVTNADPWGPSGSGSWFKWHPMNEGPITLLPGVTYEVAGATGTEAYMWNPAGFANGIVNFQASYWSSSGGLSRPTSPAFGIRYVGPNIGSVPEPSVIGAIGVLGVAWLQRRRREPR